MLDKIKYNKLLKSQILRKTKDFKQIFASAKIVSSPSITLRYLDSPNRKIGFIVSHNVTSKAVIRNRIRRYLKETYRTNKDKFLANYTYVFLARESAVTKNLHEMKNEILTLCAKVKEKQHALN